MKEHLVENETAYGVGSAQARDLPIATINVLLITAIISCWQFVYPPMMKRI